MRRGTRTWEVDCDYLACGFQPCSQPSRTRSIDLAVKVRGRRRRELTSFSKPQCRQSIQRAKRLELVVWNCRQLEGEIAGLAAANRSQGAGVVFYFIARASDDLPGP